MRMIAAATGSGPNKDAAGAALLRAIAAVFRQMMPGVPPRRGIRLDTRWGEFGLLAARYFAPLQFGTPIPATLRDAWGHIDDSILLYVFGNSDGAISDEDRARYRLVGDEPEVAPMSTLSDWHQNALQRLGELMLLKEDDLQRRATEERAGSSPARGAPAGSFARGRKWLLGAAGLLILAIALSGVKAYRIYARAMELRQDARQLETILGGDSRSEAFLQSGAILQDFDTDLSQFKAEVQPVLWLTPALSWLPRYGGDLRHAGDLLDLAIHLSASARSAQAALAPLVPAYDGSPKPTIDELIALLADAQPQLASSLQSFQLAQQARDRVDPDLLSPEVRRLITQRLDPGMSLIGDALTAVVASPSLLGAGEAGPRTYLLLAQNEDELRPTGGFITAVGKVVLDRGRVVDLSFENSADLDNWSMPYPMAPWQLSQYMNSRVLVLRDANWFPHFPTAALYIRQLYAYAHQDSVDGIVAFDQHALVMLLRTLGPIQLEGVEHPITADNVIEFMRSSKAPPTTQSLPAGWTSARKEFIGELAHEVLDRVMVADPSKLVALLSVVSQALGERHLIVQIDDPDLRPALEEHGWNGAVRSDWGDFLMVADTNVGFNKTNALIGTSLAYDVDLSDPATPVGELAIRNENRSTPGVPCVQWNEEQITGDESYPINRCYWDYMRIYVPQGTRLISGTPQSVPPEWMILTRAVTPTIDQLDEGLQGIDSFGTLIVVPGGQSVNTGLTLALPGGRILAEGPDNRFTYNLTVRKQPGTLAVPLTVRLHLPHGAVVEAPAPGWVVQGDSMQIETDLRVDRHMEVTFWLP